MTISNETALDAIAYRVESEIDGEEDLELFVNQAIEDLVTDGSISRVQACELTSLFYGQQTYH